jgi:hypothetical protein
MLTKSKRVQGWLLSERRKERRTNPTPPAPSNLQASIGEDAIALAWDEPDADEYDVLRATAEAPLAQTLLATVEGREYLDETPTVGIAYVYTVQARIGTKTGPPASTSATIPEPDPEP